MTELLLHRSPSAARTSQIVLTDSQHTSKWEVAVHPSVPNDEYTLREIFEVNPAETGIRELIGNNVLVFRGNQSRALVYVYGQPEPFKVAEDSVGVPSALFRELVAQAQTACRANAGTSMTLRIHTSLLRLGSLNSRAVLNRPMIGGSLGNFKLPPSLWGSPWNQQGASPATSPRVQAQPQVQTHTSQRQSSSAQPRPVQPRPVRAPAYCSYGHYAYQQDTLGDALFMSMFPGIAPLYRPNSMLAWYLWFSSTNYMPGPYFYDPLAYDTWAFVPGFPGAVSQMIVPFGDGYRVEILDAQGLCMANFALSGYGEQMELITGDGDVFSVCNAGQPYIQFVDGDQAFCWNGVDAPFTGSPMAVDAAIVDAGGLYEPGPMVYQDPIDYAPAYVEGQALYNDPGYADPSAVVYDNGAEPVYDNGGIVDSPYLEPNTYGDAPYVEPQQVDDGQYVDTGSVPAPSYDNSPADTYSGGGDDYATVDDSSGGDSGWSDGGGGGDDWS